MKKLVSITVAFLITQLLSAQINGNGIMNTITMEVKSLNEIDIQFNAKITIDHQASDELVTITADENVINLIGRSYNNGKLILDQIEWIEPSKMPTINIGAPNLKSLYQGTHSTTQIINLNAEKLYLQGNVGKIIASGRCKEVWVSVDGTHVDLSNTNIDYAEVQIIEQSKVILGKVNKLKTDLNKSGNLILRSEPKEYLGSSKEQIARSTPAYAVNPDLEYIKFKIKNNSWKRNHFVVIGPKKDGNTFSYGFSMMPGFSKSENWSIGTKIYRESKLGKKNLLATIEKSDEGKTVKLFQ